MEPYDDEDKPKKLNEDLVVFMRKRSDHDSPRYTARLNSYVNFQQKKRKADNARKRENNPHHHESVKVLPRPKRKNEPALKEKHSKENSARTGNKENGLKGQRHGPLSLEKIAPSAREPSDCSPRRRRRRRCRCRCRRRRGCRRRRRRRRRRC